MKYKLIIIMSCLFILCSCDTFPNNKVSLETSISSYSNRITSKEAITTSKETINSRVKEETHTRNPVYGNTLSNLVNGGYATIDDGWIYYAHDVESTDSMDSYLKKIKVDGTNDSVITEDSPSHINFVDGWVYYINHSDSDNPLGGKIYRVKPDGTKKVRLSQNDCGFMLIYNGLLYYTDLSDKSNNAESKLFKMNLDGTKVTKINDEMSTNICISGNWIFYIGWLLDESSNNFIPHLCKIKMDGSSRHIINGITTEKMIVDDTLIYYIDKSDSKVYKIDFKGINKSIVISDSVTDFNISGEWIFFIDGNQAVCKVKKTGGKKNTLYEARASLLNIVGDWIYYYNSIAEYDELYRVKKDGASNEKVN